MTPVKHFLNLLQQHRQNEHAHAYAEVPDWALRQWQDRMDTSVEIIRELKNRLDARSKVGSDQQAINRAEEFLADGGPTEA